MSAEAVIDRLPIQLAIRLLLDDVSYSNALPEWFETQTIEYVARERAIRQLVREYFGGRRASSPLRIDLPKRDGRSVSWVVPSIDDQIVCQALVSAIAERLQRKTVDAKRVFSCRLSTDPNRLAFLDDQVSAWAQFKAQTRQLCDRGTCVLQIDLEHAFASIGINSFRAFLHAQGIDRAIIRVLGDLLETLSPPGGGLPFLNNSVFFLGNAYLSKVDRVVGARARRFVRFADDYRIFAPSRAELERSFDGIATDLRRLGFGVNDRKVWVGSSEEYLSALSAIRYGKTEATEYISHTYSSPETLDPAAVLGMIKLALADPEGHIHQGYGRLLMGSIRRARATGMYSDLKGYGPSPAFQVGELLARDTATLARWCDLLEQYSRDDRNTWKLVWLLYIAKDVRAPMIADKTLQGRYGAELERIRGTAALPLVSRLWAAEMPRYPYIGKTRGQIEQLAAMGYVERGWQCYGSSLHA